MWSSQRGLCVCLSAGSDRGTRLAHLRHAAGSACETPRGSDSGRRIWKCHLAVWPRLLHPEEAPEDHRGGSCHHSRFINVWANGTGLFTPLHVFILPPWRTLVEAWHFVSSFWPSMPCGWQRWWATWAQVLWSISSLRTAVFTSWSWILACRWNIPVQRWSETWTCQLPSFR